APLTNAVMDYVLQTNDNILSKASCEKLAAAVLREGCKTSRDALDFLNGISEKRRGYKRKPASLNQNEKRVEEAKREESLTTEDDEEVTAEMVKKALDELYNK
ncbi:MAG: hypothetical protein J5736_03155, partial [Bacilli bacterium]|nr:hypothetical protein [Bacilli bacterium]